MVSYCLIGESGRKHKTPLIHKSHKFVMVKSRYAKSLIQLVNENHILFVFMMAVAVRRVQLRKGNHRNFTLYTAKQLMKVH